MAVYVKYYCSVEDIPEKVHNLGSDTLKIALTNTVPTLTHTTLSQIGEISAGFGYTGGGGAVTVSSSSQTTGTYKLIVSDVTFTASGGSIGPFRYAVLHNETANKLLGYWDVGTETTITTGNTYTCDFDATNGVIQVV